MGLFSRNDPERNKEKLAARIEQLQARQAEILGEIESKENELSIALATGKPSSSIRVALGGLHDEHKALPRAIEALQREVLEIEREQRNAERKRGAAEWRDAGKRLNPLRDKAIAAVAEYHAAIQETYEAMDAGKRYLPPGHRGMGNLQVQLMRGEQSAIEAAEAAARAIEAQVEDESETPALPEPRPARQFSSGVGGVSASKRDRERANRAHELSKLAAAGDDSARHELVKLQSEG